MSWDLATPAQPVPMTWAWQVLYMYATPISGVSVLRKWRHMRDYLANTEQQCTWQTFLLYSTCKNCIVRGIGIGQKKNSINSENPSTLVTTSQTYMLTVPNSSKVSSTCKCKFSMKATTNGNPNMEQKWKKLE